MLGLIVLLLAATCLGLAVVDALPAAAGESSSEAPVNVIDGASEVSQHTAQLESMEARRQRM